AGPQLLDGRAALTYSRIRHPDSDFARMKRQQAVLVALLARLRDDNTLSSLAQVEAMTTTLRDYVRTDLPESHILGLAWALR
ncbi:LCP family protein, partial [Klebsiella pneumoniae]|nr:LCP family protein [Klebsiella pneumoniae]